MPVGLFAKETAPAFPDVPKEHPFAQTIETLKQKVLLKAILTELFLRTQRFPALNL